MRFVYCSMPLVVVHFTVLLLGVTGCFDSKDTPFVVDTSTPEPKPESLNFDRKTWFEKGGQVYGAKPDNRGQIGGGKGYTQVVTSGNFTVKNADQLVSALSKAKPGQIVFIPGRTGIDLTALVHIEGLRLTIPKGVTLASDRGHNGSPGALIESDALTKTEMFTIGGEDVRITGLRIKGPVPKRHIHHYVKSFGGYTPAKGRGLGRDYYYKFPVSSGIRTTHSRLEVDNCEISGFAYTGVFLSDGQEHHIHHNYIHHCQYLGLGYGVMVDKGFALIEFNLLDWNRHSLAGTGRPEGGYIARHNVELGESLSHCFDMHGGADRQDGTNVAGKIVGIMNNTFRAPEDPIVIRGVPVSRSTVSNNWFVKNGRVETQGNVSVFRNAFGTGREIR